VLGAFAPGAGEATAQGAAGQGAKAAAPIPFLAHRAVYDLTLGKSSGSSAPSDARGRIVYEFSGSACEGYVTNFRQITEVQLEEGGSRVSDMRSTSFEEGDGSSFRYKTDSYMDGQLMESIDGKARKDAADELTVSLSSPRKADMAFPSGALFPTAQMMRIVDVAKGGGKTTEVKIFDGSDTGLKVFDTLSVIGHQSDGMADDPAVADAQALQGVRRWPVSVSYFDPAKRDGQPNYVLGFDLYENGVSGALKIDYGNYALIGKLTKFETLPQKACN
jgi:hypothetical protein